MILGRIPIGITLGLVICCTVAIIALELTATSVWIWAAAGSISRCTQLAIVWFPAYWHYREQFEIANWKTISQVLSGGTHLAVVGGLWCIASIVIDKKVCLLVRPRMQPFQAGC